MHTVPRAAHARHPACALLCTLLSSVAVAQSGYDFLQEPSRYALVVGNPTYAHQAQLPSVAQDVERTAALLEALQFKVTRQPTFPSVRDFEDNVLPKFRSQIQPGDIVVFYFSGHGFAYGQNNFIAPADLPQTVQSADITSAAIAVENLEDYFARRSPGFILIIVDACRSIAGFIVTDASNNNLVAKGMVEAQNTTNADNALFAFASRPGTPALATSDPGKQSIFTQSLDAYIDTAEEFESLFKQVSSEVAVTTHNAQRPGMVVWSDSDLYLSPTPTVLAQEATAWQSALSSQQRDQVLIFLRRFATSPHAAAARKWLDDHPEQGTPKPSMVSPVAVERSWNPHDSTRRLFADTGLNWGYPQHLDSVATARAEALSNTALGIEPSGHPASSYSVSSTLASFAAHGSAIATDEITAHVAPSNSSQVASHLPSGTLFHVDGVQPGTSGDQWLVATLPNQTNSFYVLASSRETPPVSLDLGHAIREVIVPPDASFPDLVNTKVITDTLAALKAKGKAITWVSLATGLTSDAHLTLIRSGELSHAEFVLKQSGVDAAHLTALSGVHDFAQDGVRLRFFGY